MRKLLSSLLLLSATTVPGPGIEFRPREGSELAKRFETTVSLDLDDLAVEMNGQQIDPAMMGGGFDVDALTLDAALEFGVLDTYVAMGNGRPLELLREFRSVKATYEDGMGNSASDEGEDLADRSVRFRWDDEQQAYARSFEGDGGDEEDLPIMNEDMDLRDLLPPADLLIGGKWNLAWSEHLGLLVPGIDLAAVQQKIAEEASGETMSEEDRVGLAVVEGFLAGLREAFADATATCTLQETREVDGQALGVVAIASEIDATIDLAALLEAMDDQIPEGVSFDRLELEISVDVTGELLWDLAGGHFRSLDLDAEIDGEIALEVSADAQGSTFTGSATAEFSGEIGRNASIE